MPSGWPSRRRLGVDSRGRLSHTDVTFLTLDGPSIDVPSLLCRHGPVDGRRGSGVRRWCAAALPCRRRSNVPAPGANLKNPQRDPLVRRGNRLGNGRIAVVTDEFDEVGTWRQGQPTLLHPREHPVDARGEEVSLASGDFAGREGKLPAGTGEHDAEAAAARFWDRYAAGRTCRSICGRRVVWARPTEAKTTAAVKAGVHCRAVASLLAELPRRALVARSAMPKQ